jgi:hypothetical protein
LLAIVHGLGRVEQARGINPQQERIAS